MYNRQDVCVGQAVPGVKFHAAVDDLFANRPDGFQLFKLSFARGVGISTGMNFDGVGAALLGSVDLFCDGVEKQADDDSRVVQPLDGIGKFLNIPCNVQPAFSRDFLTPFRNDRRLIGNDLTGDSQYVFVARQLHVELAGNGLTQDEQVSVLNMPAIFAKMNGDAVRSAQLRQRRGGNRVWLVGQARLTNRCNVVNIDS